MTYTVHTLYIHCTYTAGWVRHHNSDAGALMQPRRAKTLPQGSYGQRSSPCRVIKLSLRQHPPVPACSHSVMRPLWCSKYDTIFKFFLSHFLDHFLSYFSYFFSISFFLLYPLRYTQILLKNQNLQQNSLLNTTLGTFTTHPDQKWQSNQHIIPGQPSYTMLSQDNDTKTPTHNSTTRHR
jgi:hypothetical protein